VVVRDLDIKRIAVLEPEADTPSIVDRDRILALSIPGELVQSVSRRHPQIVDAARKIDVLDFSPCPPRDLRRQSTRSPRREELLRVPVSERLDHGMYRNVSRDVCQGLVTTPGSAGAHVLTAR